MLYFFLSYARGSDDTYVRQFFNDLCVEVRLLAGLREDEEVGFLDNENIQPGDVWATTLVQALSRCRSFLPLCSPRFFRSEPCGREWAIFEARIRHHQDLHQTRPSTLIPLRWLPSKRMPDYAARLQYFVEPELEGQQANPGIRQLMRLSRNRDDYLAFMTRLAERIVDAAHDDPLQEGPSDLDWVRVRSAFPLGAPSEPAAINGVPIADSAKRVHFVVSASTAAQPPAGRRNVAYYGNRPIDWAPYHPQSPEPIVAYATQIALEAQLQARVISVDQLDETLAEARAKNQVVVILVDAWSTKIPQNRAILQRYDERDERAAAVMIPVNSADEESRDNAKELEESLRQTFPDNWHRRESSRFRRRVLDLASFEPELQTVLEETQNWIFANPVIHRQLPPSTERPILEGP